MEPPTQTTHFVAPSIEDLQPLFPSYEIQDFIAQGGMGAVYKARQISLDRPVAIKILPREFGQDPTFRASFEAEAKAMARLNHPNLIGVYDFGEVDGMLFLVMEMVQGKSLFHSSYGKAIDPTQAAEIVIAICRGLDHAHSADILHRDVKPANILLSPDATPKIGDFGLASPMNETASQDEVIYGTPGYTAPEIIHRLQVDRRADIFSTGVMLHELLTGVTSEQANPSPSILCGCPIAFDAIVAKSTQPNPELRYSTAAEFADDLEKALKTAPVATQLNLSPAVGMPRPYVPSPLPVAKQKSPALAVTLTLIGILVVGAGIYLANSGGGSPAPTKVAQTPTDPSPPPKPTSVKPKDPINLTPAPVPVSPPDAQKEKTHQALARLKQKLAGGERDEFPDGTVERADSHFLLLRQPKTWPEALLFAEEHGAHLAIAASPEDRQFLIRSFDLKQPAWLGAGIAANERWQWLDDTPWKAEDNPETSGYERRFIALTKDGKLDATAPIQTYSIILQWRKDSSNPCTLDAQLKRAADSVAKDGIDQARYPVGTRTYQKSHFLLIPESSTWENAHQFAKVHKAQLAVPSSASENQWLVTTYSDDVSYWLGGYQLKPSSPWQWITREAWGSSGMKPGEPKSDPAYNRLLMTASSKNPQSWVASQGTKGEATSILLEWSNPKTVNTVATFDLDKWLASVNRKIADRVEPDVESYKKNRDSLIDKYIRTMKRAAKKIEVPDIPGGRGGRGRGRGAERANYIVNLVKEAMDNVDESRELPESIPERAPDEFHEIHKLTEKTLEKLDEDYQAKLKAHLDFYSQGLLKKVTELEQSGFYQAADSIKKSVESIGDDTSKLLSTLGL